jgi:hypothetical protein
MDELTALELIARLKEYGIAYTPKEDIDALVEHLEKTFVNRCISIDGISVCKIGDDLSVND